MDPNPYESPKSTNQSATPSKWIRVIVVDIIAALFGAAAAFIITAPAGAIDGGGEYYAVMGAMVGVIAHRLLRWQYFLALREQSIEANGKQTERREQQDQ